MQKHLYNLFSNFYGLKTTHFNQNQISIAAV